MKNKIILLTLLVFNLNVFAVKTATAVAGVGAAVVFGFVNGSVYQRNECIKDNIQKGIADVSVFGIGAFRDPKTLSDEDKINIVVAGTLNAIWWGGIAAVVLVRKTPAWRLRSATKNWNKMSATSVSYSDFQLRASAIDASLHRAEADFTKIGFAKHGEELYQLKEHITHQRHNARVKELFENNSGTGY